MTDSSVTQATNSEHYQLQFVSLQLLTSDNIRLQLTLYFYTTNYQVQPNTKLQLQSS